MSARFALVGKIILTLFRPFQAFFHRLENATNIKSCVCGCYSACLRPLLLSTFGGQKSNSTSKMLAVDFPMTMKSG